MPLGNLTRPQWGGADSTIDIHMEEHTGIVDSTFLYRSQFAGITNMRNIRGTNTIRLDRVGSTSVRGRKVGEPLTRERVRNDKFNLNVDTLLYARHEMDNMDEWMSSLDMRKEIATNNGTKFAQTYDQGCIIQLQKAADFKAPDYMGDAFHDGILLEETIADDGGSAADLADSAAILVRAHRRSIEQLVDRDLGPDVYSSGITFVSPAVFTVLLDHDKLMNVQFGAPEGSNSFTGGRVATMNGIRVVETPRFPRGAIEDHPLGEDFDVSADVARREIITMLPEISLIGATLQPLTSKIWPDNENFSVVLDDYTSYNLTARRPDSVAVVGITRS